MMIDELELAGIYDIYCASLSFHQYGHTSDVSNVEEWGHGTNPIITWPFSLELDLWFLLISNLENTTGIRIEGKPTSTQLSS